MQLICILNAYVTYTYNNEYPYISYVMYVSISHTWSTRISVHVEYPYTVWMCASHGPATTPLLFHFISLLVAFLNFYFSELSYSFMISCLSALSFSQLVSRFPSRLATIVHIWRPNLHKHKHSYTSFRFFSMVSVASYFSLFLPQSLPFVCIYI